MSQSSKKDFAVIKTYFKLKNGENEYDKVCYKLAQEFGFNLSKPVNKQSHLNKDCSNYTSSGKGSSKEAANNQNTGRKENLTLLASSLGLSGFGRGLWKRGSSSSSTRDKKTHSESSGSEETEEKGEELQEFHKEENQNS